MPASATALMFECRCSTKTPKRCRTHCASSRWAAGKCRNAGRRGTRYSGKQLFCCSSVAEAPRPVHWDSRSSAAERKRSFASPATAGVCSVARCGNGLTAAHPAHPSVSILALVGQTLSAQTRSEVDVGSETRGTRRLRQITTRQHAVVVERRASSTFEGEQTHVRLCSPTPLKGPTAKRVLQRPVHQRQGECLRESSCNR